MLRRLRSVMLTLLQGAYGVSIEVVALVALLAAGGVIAFVLSRLV